VADLSVDAIPKSQHKALKDLRACTNCRRIKAYSQFLDAGCENCPELPRRQAEEWTTVGFEGFMAIIDPQQSWAAKWQHHRDMLPGCYAITIRGAQNTEHYGGDGDAANEDDAEFIADDGGARSQTHDGDGDGEVVL